MSPAQYRLDPFTTVAEFQHLLETALVWEDEDGVVWWSPEDTDDEDYLSDWLVVFDPELGYYVWRHTYPELLARRWFVSCGAALAA